MPVRAAASTATAGAFKASNLTSKTHWSAWEAGRDSSGARPSLFGSEWWLGVPAELREGFLGR